MVYGGNCLLEQSFRVTLFLSPNHTYICFISEGPGSGWPGEMPPTLHAFVQVFAELEAHQERLQIENIQLSMSTLEDVFLRIAKESEVEAARKEQVRPSLVPHWGRGGGCRGFASPNLLL